MELKKLDSDALLANYKELSAKLDAMVTEVRRRKIAWRTLADEGFTILAIRSHQDTFKSSLREAKNAVDEYRESRKAQNLKTS